jgi:phosphohistidine phosphatase SixA
MNMRWMKPGLMAVLLLASLWAQAGELSDKLQTPDYVLLMRHARAPGIGDPAHFALGDCATQRNLSAEGRKQAVVIGHWLKKQGIASAALYTSAWCRCKDTAELLHLGRAQVEPSLASFFDEMHKAPESTRQLQRFVADKVQTKGQQALILVTHHVNIEAFTGQNIGSGDMVLAKVDPKGQLLSYRLIPRPD